MPHTGFEPEPTYEGMHHPVLCGINLNPLIPIDHAARQNHPCAGTWQNCTLYSGGRSGLLVVDQIEAIAITTTRIMIRMAHRVAGMCAR